SRAARPRRAHAASSSCSEASRPASELREVIIVLLLRDLDAPDLRPLLEIFPAVGAATLRLELIPERKGIVVVHEDERLPHRERIEGLRDRRVLFARWNDADVELCGAAGRIGHRNV